MTLVSCRRAVISPSNHDVLVAVLSWAAVLVGPGVAHARSEDARTESLVEALPVEVKEGNAGTTEVTFSVRLRYTPTGRDPIEYELLPRTAQPGEDYLALPAGTLTFDIGQTAARTLTVAIVGDTTRECDEGFVLRLQHSFRGAPLDVLAVIKDDDGLPAGVTCPEPSARPAGPPIDAGAADVRPALADAAPPDAKAPAAGGSSGCAFVPGATRSGLTLPLLVALALMLRGRRHRNRRRSSGDDSLVYDRSPSWRPR